MTILALNVKLSRFFKKMAYSMKNVILVYIMKIHKYEKKFLFEKYAHNVIRYRLKEIYLLDDLFTRSHTTKVRIFYLLMMFVDVGY
jgi:hypothetical protein